MDFLPRPLATYCEAMSSVPSQICQEIEAFTLAHVPRSQMLSGSLVGACLGLFAADPRVRRVLEVGTYTGYSALAMAERLGEGGELITLDIDPETHAIARRFWDKSPHGAKIRSITGPALSSLETLEGPFDLAFIDADKGGYRAYLDQILTKLAPGGVIIADNCLWSGRVLESPHQADESTRAIQDFNQYVANHRDLNSVLLPVRDGLNVIRKKRN